jgi:hypothetical protein
MRRDCRQRTWAGDVLEDAQDDDFVAGLDRGVDGPVERRELGELLLGVDDDDDDALGLGFRGEALLVLRVGLERGFGGWLVFLVELGLEFEGAGLGDAAAAVEILGHGAAHGHQGGLGLTIRGQGLLQEKRLHGVQNLVRRAVDGVQRGLRGRAHARPRLRLARQRAPQRAPRPRRQATVAVVAALAHRPAAPHHDALITRPARRRPLLRPITPLARARALQLRPLVHRPQRARVTRPRVRLRPPRPRTRLRRRHLPHQQLLSITLNLSLSLSPNQLHFQLMTQIQHSSHSLTLQSRQQ